MKNLLTLLMAVAVFSCSQPQQTEETVADEVTPAEERSIGFNTMLPDETWHLGTNDYVDIVKDLDKAWAAHDYETMRTFLADTATFSFEDGRYAASADEFIEMIKADDPEGNSSWTFDYAFSVDLSPGTGGEHVHAGFTGNTEGEENKVYHEWYYIIDGKIMGWSQYARAMPAEADEE